VHDIDTYLRMFASFPIMSLPQADGRSVLAVIGGAQIGASHKNLLALGMLLLAREQGLIVPGQPIIESSSGSMAEGLGVAGKLLGHPIIIVTDPNLPAITRMKVELLGVELRVVASPHPTLGWQEARELAVREMLARDPSLYWTDQNNSPLNPQVYRRWLIPELERQLDPRTIDAVVLCVGSGGHFAAIAGWIKQRNPAASAVAVDREGSIVFGEVSGPSLLRGVGNQNMIPRVIDAHRHLADQVVVVSDAEAFSATRRIARERGFFVGGSSGAAYAGVEKLLVRAEPSAYKRVLTMFADRGELYWDTIYDDSWMQAHGL
jgi:cysteine synthase